MEHASIGFWPKLWKTSFKVNELLVKENEILEKQNNRLSEMGKNIDNLFFFRLEDFYGFFW